MSNQFNQEKVASIREELINSVYIPAFAQLVNEKAAAAGLGTLINNENDLRKALEMAQVIEENEKQASAVSPLDFVHNLVFSKQAADNQANTFVSETVKSLNLAEKIAQAVETPASN